MSHKKFDKFLEEQQEIVPTSFDWAPRIAEWKSDLDDFYKRIESFLKTYLDHGKIQLEYGTKKFIDESIGDHEAKIAIIRIGSNTIKLEPVGLNIVGARGRCDLIGPRATIRFLLVDKAASEPRQLIRVTINGEKHLPDQERQSPKEWEWKIATPPPHMQFYPLTSESFLDSLMTVTNG
jgi:hypothetical protein